MELQRASISSLHAKGGSEAVNKDDIWFCLFGDAVAQQTTNPDNEGRRQLTAQAAELRLIEGSGNGSSSSSRDR